MIFATFDLKFWYKLVKDGIFSLDEYKKWLDKIQDIGFTHVVVDENILPLVYKELSNRDLGIHFSVLCAEKVSDKDSSHYHVSPWRSDGEFIYFEDFMEKYFDRYMSISKNSFSILQEMNNQIIVSINPATFLESTFYVEHPSYIMDGSFLQSHDEMITILSYLSEKCYDLHPYPQLVVNQIIGFGAENKKKYDLDGYSLLKEFFVDHSEKQITYCTPTQSAHDSKYLATNIIYQNGLKKNFNNLSLAWGAMGINGFPVTTPMAYLNNVDEMFMFTNELECDRMTRVGFDDVSENQVGLIKDVIKSVNCDDVEMLKKIMRHQSKRFYKSSGDKIYDDHFSLEGLG